VEFNAKIKITFTKGCKPKVSVISPDNVIYVNKDCLAFGEPKSDFWKLPENLHEYRELTRDPLNMSNLSSSEPSFSDGPIPIREPTRDELANQLENKLRQIMESKSPLVVGAISDVQFMDRDFGRGNTFCKHDSVRVVREGFAIMSGKSKGCYASMENPISESVIKALKKFISTRCVIQDWRGVKEVKPEMIKINSHDCAIDVLMHFINHVVGLLNGQLAKLAPAMMM
jgi:hypothetical protein